MITKILRVNDNEAVLYYDNKPSVRIYNSNGGIIDFLKWFFAPTVLCFSSYTLRQKCSQQDTIVCHQEAA